MTTQLFQNFYNVAYVSYANNKIELSINNILFTLENDKELDSCNVYDAFTGIFLDEIACYQFDTSLGVNDYPNDMILDFIVTNLID